MEDLRQAMVHQLADLEVMQDSAARQDHLQATVLLLEDLAVAVEVDLLVAVLQVVVVVANLLRRMVPQLVVQEDLAAVDHQPHMVHHRLLTEHQLEVLEDLVAPVDMEVQADLVVPVDLVVPADTVVLEDIAVVEANLHLLMVPLQEDLVEAAVLADPVEAVNLQEVTELRHKLTEHQAVRVVLAVDPGDSVDNLLKVTEHLRKLMEHHLVAAAVAAVNSTHLMEVTHIK